jgi:hypothetical protein
VLDFYCARARLAIEIDGTGHEFGDRPQRDERRDAWLKQYGKTIVHVRAGKLQYEADEIADSIVRLALEAAPSTALTRGPPCMIERPESAQAEGASWPMAIDHDADGRDR